MIRIYGIRWDIEVFFKCTKSLLRLQKEFQGRSYDLLIGHTTIVFSRYILLAWQHRQSTDSRTFGGLFYLLCDEVGTLDWAIALTATDRNRSTKYGSRSWEKNHRLLIQRQLQQWIAALPNYIKAICPFHAAKVEIVSIKDIVNISNKQKIEISSYNELTILYLRYYN